MLLNVNKQQLALIFDAVAQYTENQVQYTAEAYTEAGTPITPTELQLHYDLLIEALSEHVEVEEGQWSFDDEDKLVDCCTDENE